MIFIVKRSLSVDEDAACAVLPDSLSFVVLGSVVAAWLGSVSGAVPTGSAVAVPVVP